MGKTTSLKIYEYAACSTCKKALQFLKKRGASFAAVPIIDEPPSVPELKRMLAHQGGELRRLFNTSGVLYREMGLSEKLPAMSTPAALALLAKHGKLVKRPFLLGPDFGLVGFQEAEWKKHT